MGKYSMVSVGVCRLVFHPVSHSVTHTHFDAQTLTNTHKQTWRFIPLVCVCVPQGLRVGDILTLSQARRFNVEQGCSVPDPCVSNPCPSNSYCSDDWDSHSCTCLTGQ